MNGDPAARRVFLICTDEETSKDVGEMLKRVSSALSVVDTFSDSCTRVDEDGPNFEAEFARVLNRMILTLMEIYPNPAQMAADVKSMGDFTVRTIEI